MPVCLHPIPLPATLSTTSPVVLQTLGMIHSQHSYLLTAGSLFTAPQARSAIETFILETVGHLLCQQTHKSALCSHPHQLSSSKTHPRENELADKPTN